MFPTSVSPPPAPKHAVAPPTRTKKDKEGKPVKDGTGTPSKGPAGLGHPLTTQQPLNRILKAPRLESTPEVEMGRSDGDSRSSSPDEDIADDGSSSSDTPSPWRPVPTPTSRCSLMEGPPSLAQVPRSAPQR